MKTKDPLDPNVRPDFYQSFPIKLLKAIEAEGIVEAVVNVFGLIDYGKDIVHNGAFAKTIQEFFRYFRVLDQHNTDSTTRVLGKIVEIRELGRNELNDIAPDVLKEFPGATGGLYVKMRFNMKTQAGREVFYLIEAGDVAEYSFGYDIIRADASEITNEDGEKIRVRNLRELRLWEVSPVIWGMNYATTTIGTKDMKNQKELTGDGPTQRLGDLIHAITMSSFMACAIGMYKSGYLSPDEWATLNTLGIGKLDELRKLMDNTVAERPIQRYYSLYDYMEIGDEGAEAEKTSPDERLAKAGRVLSAANANRIKTALNELYAVLKAAGVISDDEDEDDAADTEESDKGVETPAEPVEEPLTEIASKKRALELRASLLISP